MDLHVIDTAFRRVLGYADTVRFVQRRRSISGPFGDASELGFARQLAKAVAADAENQAALVRIADHLHLTSELMSFHHHRLPWERAHDRVNWGYVSVTLRTIAIALREVVPEDAGDGHAAELHLSTDLIDEVAGSLSVEAVDRLIAALGDARRTAAHIDPNERLDPRVRDVAATPWPTVSGVRCTV